MVVFFIFFKKKFHHTISFDHFPLSQLLSDSPPPPYPPNFIFLFFPKILENKKKTGGPHKIKIQNKQAKDHQEEKRKLQKQNKCSSKQNKQTITTTKPWSSFRIGQLLLGMGLDLTRRVVVIPSDIPLEKIDFPFTNRYQLQMASWLELGPTVHFPLSMPGSCLA